MLLLRQGAAGPVRVRSLVAELEFDLSDALRDGPIAFRLAPPRAGGSALTEPWRSLYAEGLRRIVLEPGLAGPGLRRLVELLAATPPVGSDRRTELWLAQLPRVRFDAVRRRPPRDADGGRVLAPRRITARRRLDPEASPPMLQPLAEDDLRLRLVDGGLDWLSDLVPLPELAPEVVSDEEAALPAGPRQRAARWRRFVHLALAAEAANRVEGDPPQAPPIVLGCFDALIALGDGESLRTIIEVLKASSWPEARVLLRAITVPERLRPLAKLVDGTVLPDVAPAEAAPPRPARPPADPEPEPIVGASQPPPAPTAAELFCELLDLLEALGNLHREGRSPSLQPLCWLVQDLVEAMGDHRPALELLTVVRDHRRPVTATWKWASVAVHALGFGHSLGLPRRELLALGLAAILASLGDEADPQAAVRALVRYGALGALAPVVLDAVHGLFAHGDLAEGDRIGELLLTVTSCFELGEGEEGRPALAPAHALMTLGSGRHPRVEARLGHSLALHRGAWPVGSLLRLSNERPALVLGWAEGEAHGRPLVAPLRDDGKLDRPIDLADIRSMQILETFAPRSVDLSRLASAAALPELPASLRAALRGPSVSLSYELEGGDDEADSTGFDLSIDEPSLTLDGAETLNRVLDQTLEWQPEGEGDG